MSSTVEQIKERLSIVDVVSSYLKLEKAGKNLKARCPFHTEKTPSFMISPGREAFHCFGCGKGGDIFTFVEEIEGLDFSGALKVLAERAGVEIPRFDSKTEDKKKRIYSVLEEATLFFESQLRAHKEVGEYLKSRGLLGKTAKIWRLGYALPEWRTLYSFLKDNNFTDEEMALAGLINASQGRVYDRFRGRIMFPILDSSGRPVAFSGRIFVEMQDEKTPSAKYINSPETALYSKSRILYGFDKAKMGIRKQDSCIVVEGQMDVIMSHQAGFTNTVAASGTAFTEEHLSLIGRLTKNIILAFDADEAGFRAMERGIGSALSSGFAVRIVHLPQDTDPADMVKEDEKKWGEYIGKAKHVIEFYLDMLLEAHKDERSARLKIEEKVIPFIARLKSPIEQAHFVKLVAKSIHIDEDTIWRSIKKYGSAESVSKNKEEGGARIALTAQNPDKTRLLNIEKHIYSIFLWQQKEEKPEIDVEDLQKKFEDITEKQITREITAFSEEDKARLVFEAEAAHEGSKKLDATIEAMFADLLTQTLKVKLTFAMEAVKEAERNGDEARAKEALSEFHSLSKKMNDAAAIHA